MARVAGALLFAALLTFSPLLAFGAVPTQGGLERRLKEGWIGRYAQKDESIRKVIGANEGWAKFREMDLYEAIRFFSMVTDQASRIGAARSYVELAKSYGALEDFFVDIETQYLDELGMQATAGQRARLGFCHLLRGKTQKAKEIFSAESPKDRRFHWSVGRLGVAHESGQKVDMESELKKLAESASKEQRTFLKVAAHAWGHDIPVKDTAYYGQSIQAMKDGDLFGALVALQMMDNPGNHGEPGPELYLYALLRQVFSKMAVESVKGMEGIDAYFVSGQAKLLLGDYEGAAADFALASKALENPSTVVATRVFGAEIDEAEMVGLARVNEGLAKFKAGKVEEAKRVWIEFAATPNAGRFELSRLAAAVADAKVGILPEVVAKMPGEAVGEVATLTASALRLPGGDTAAKLLDTRGARIARDAALVARTGQRYGEALDVLDQAHIKRQGNRPSFANPPTFMVDLARAYAETGEFAPAVEILFELSRQYPSSRMAYESLKRLYASTTGGEAPPR